SSLGSDFKGLAAPHGPARKGCSHPGGGEASTKMKPFAALIFFLFNRFRSSTLGSPVKQKNPTFVGLYFGWRRGRDWLRRTAPHAKAAAIPEGGRLQPK